jgi:hypothetical protein
MVLTTEGKIIPPQLSRILKLSRYRTVRYGRQRPKSRLSGATTPRGTSPFQGTVGEGPENLRSVADGCRRAVSVKLSLTGLCRQAPEPT